MDESGAIQTQPLDYIKMCVAVIKLLRLKSLTFGGHLRSIFTRTKYIIKRRNIFYNSSNKICVCIAINENSRLDVEFRLLTTIYRFFM